MFSFLKALIQPIVSLVLIPWMQQKVIVTKNDKARFDLIQALAAESADAIVANNPTDDAAILAQRVVQDVGSAFPTSNERVIYRAAASAVRRAIETYGQ